jgi:hypothetical protein
MGNSTPILLHNHDSQKSENRSWHVITASSQQFEEPIKEPSIKLSVICCLFSEIWQFSSSSLVLKIFQKKSKPDSSISKSVIFLGGKKSSKCNTDSIFWQKSLLPHSFQNRVLKFSLFLGQCVITGLSTGCCFNGPVSKRLQLSQNLFRATIATLNKKLQKNPKKKTLFQIW